MTTQITVPALGESVTEATVSKWFKQVGDTIAVDEPLVELETEKVTVEVPAPVGGTLENISVAEGADVEVGAVLGAITEAAVAAVRAAGGMTAPAEPAGNGASKGAPVDIAIPDLGESVTEGTIGKWLKAVGDRVAADEPLVEVETEKVTAELPAPVAGVLSEILVQDGTDVAVGTVVARIVPGDGAAATAALAAAPAEAPKAPAAPAAPATAVAPAVAAAAPTAAAPTAVQSDGPLSPAVRKLVDENGLNPSAIPATGPGGRLTKGDVLSFLAGGGKAAPVAPVAAAAPATPAALPPREPDPRGEERVRMTKLRRVIAARLKEAQNTAAMLTTFNEVDMQAVMDARADYREAFEKKHGVRLGFMSFFVKAAVMALKELPAINAEIYGDEVIYKNFYDIGIAVGSPTGLVVPVLRDADKRSFADIESSIRDFGVRARDGKLTMGELTGGTFTVTNGGIFGSLLSTPIINPPQSAILGMHKIQNRPMAVGKDVVVRPVMYLALSYDHRIVDGREAVTFLVRLKDALEDPQRLLLDI